MVYQYRCERCEFEVEVTRPVARYADLQKCPTCMTFMQKVFSPPHITMNHLEPQYNPAFGKVIHNKKELKEALAHTKGETGTELVEVGNDSLKSIKKQTKPYTMEGMRLGDFEDIVRKENLK